VWVGHSCQEKFGTPLERKRRVGQSGAASKKAKRKRKVVISDDYSLDTNATLKL
jgi:hypothetical protein